MKSNEYYALSQSPYVLESKTLYIYYIEKTRQVEIQFAQNEKSVIYKIYKNDLEKKIADKIISKKDLYSWEVIKVLDDIRSSQQLN